MFPLTSIALFCFGWLIFNVPAAYYGAYIAFSMTNDKPLCKISTVRRLIPKQPWYLRSEVTILLSGFLMFSTIISEFHYVITSVWRSYMIGLFGFIFLNISLLAIVVSLISIINTYLCL
jgi:hypothetical protein